MTGGRSIRTRDGVDIAVWDLGSGPPLLLIHGFTGCRRSWGAGLIERLSGSRRVIAVDLVGHGDSGAASSEEAYRLGPVMADLIGVLQALDVRAVDVAGYSMGARIALGFACTHPDRVRRLVLESGSPGLATPEERADRRARDEEWAQMLERDGIEPFVERWMRLPLFETQAKSLGVDVLEEQRQIRLANRPGALTGILRGLGTGCQPSFWTRLSRLAVPTLVLVGERDPKFVDIGKRMAKALPDARLRIVPGAGHAVHLEAAAAWLDAVESFLSRAAGA